MENEGIGRLENRAEDTKDLVQALERRPIVQLGHDVFATRVELKKAEGDVFEYEVRHFAIPPEVALHPDYVMGIKTDEAHIEFLKKARPATLRVTVGEEAITVNLDGLENRIMIDDPEKARDILRRAAIVAFKDSSRLATCIMTEDGDYIIVPIAMWGEPFRPPETSGTGVLSLPCE